MAESSKYVFFGRLINGKKYVPNVFVIALNRSSNVAHGWESNEFENANDFRFLASRAAGTRQITVAIIAGQALEHFPIKATLEHFSIYAFERMTGPGIYFGASVVTVLKDITVADVQPIFGWQGLPLRQEQLLEMQRLKLRTGAFAVTLVTNDFEFIE